MISQTAEYALRAMVFLAMSEPEPRTNEQIAETTRVPAGYLSKVMQSLGRAGLVKSRRGIGGGFVLSRSPARISILEVVNAVDPVKRIESCPLDLPTHGSHLCALHKRLDDAANQVEKAFAATTLAEILKKPTRSIPLTEKGSSRVPGGRGKPRDTSK
ncbi:MAG: Rrf2 family transcriptional regulator [Candidatus Obscuribacterales bacterium]